MRLGLIADIHADPRALEATLRHLEALGVDQIVCAGDLVGYGSEPDAVVALIRDRAIPCIRGNHDRWALERRQVIGLRGWKPAVLKRRHLGVPPGTAGQPAGSSAADTVVAVHHGSPASDTEFVSPYKPLPASIERFWDGGRRRHPGPGALAHPHDRPRPAGHDHQPRLGPGRAGRPDVVQLRRGRARDRWRSLIHDVRTGREIHRDPVFLDGE